MIILKHYSRNQLPLLKKHIKELETYCSKAKDEEWKEGKRKLIQLLKIKEDLENPNKNKKAKKQNKKAKKQNKKAKRQKKEEDKSFFEKQRQKHKAKKQNKKAKKQNKKAKKQNKKAKKQNKKAKNKNKKSNKRKSKAKNNPYARASNRSYCYRARPRPLKLGRF